MDEVCDPIDDDGLRHARYMHARMHRSHHPLSFAEALARHGFRLGTL